MELYLVRHGETKLNKKGVYYGWTDCGLSETGVLQGKTLHNSLKEYAIDYVISSPLKRAVQTACLVSHLKEEQLIIDERLKELNFGQWEGKHFKEIEKEDNDNWQKWSKDWKNFVIPDGESFLQFYNRILQFVLELQSSYEDKKVMIIAHQGGLRSIMSILLGMEEEGCWHFTFEQGKYSVLEIHHQHCVIKKLNCV